MGAAQSQPQKTTLADELDKLGQKFIEDFAQAKNLQEQVRNPLDYMCEMQRPCVELLAGMKETISNVPREAQQDFIDCIRDFNKLLKETMNHCVALKDVLDEQTSAISNMKKLKRLANEHGRAVVGNPTFRTFAEKARNSVAASSQKIDVTRPATEHLITQYSALGQRFAALQTRLADSTAHSKKMRLIFVGVASVLAIATVVCIVLAVVLPPCAAAISTAKAGAIVGLSGGAIACAAVASTAGATAIGCSAGAGMVTDYQEKAANIEEDKLNGLEDDSTNAAKLLEIFNVKCGNARNAGQHVDGSPSGPDDGLDLNVLFANLQEDSDMMDSLDEYRVSIQELRRSIDNLEKESGENYMKMVAF